MKIIIFFTSKYKLVKIGINKIFDTNNKFIDITKNASSGKIYLINDDADIKIFNKIKINKNDDIVYVYHSKTNVELINHLNNNFENVLRKKDLHEIVGNNKSKYYILLKTLNNDNKDTKKQFNEIWKILKAKPNFDDIKLFLQILNLKKITNLTLPVSLQNYKNEFNIFISKASTNDEQNYNKAFIEFRDVLIKDVYF